MTEDAAGATEAAPAPALSLPKGGGAIRGIGERFDVNPCNGTASFSVPMALSAARYTPPLDLSYDSGNGNGPFGFGWRLTQPAISRRTDRGVPRYDEDDVFLLTGADDLVACGVPQERPGYRVQRYRPCVDRDLTRVERWTRLADGDVHWRTLTRDDHLTVYGLDPSSRIGDPADPRRVVSWLASHSYDDRGNAVVYDYVPEDDAGVGPAAAEQGRVRSANRYLKRIRYGNRQPLLLDPERPSYRPPHVPAPDLSAAGWMFEVVLDYGEGHCAPAAPDGDGRVYVTAMAAVPDGATWPARTDSFSSYRAGFEVRTHRLCRRILMFHHFPAELGTADCLVRSTEFAYTETPSGSFVTGITRSGYRRATDGRYRQRSLPTVRLSYSPFPLANPAYDGSGTAVLDADTAADLPLGGDDSRWVDLDGEGIPGVLAQDGGAWRFTPNRGRGRLGAAQPLPRQPASRAAASTLALDLAGDGALDLVWLDPPAPGFHTRTPDGGFAAFRSFGAVPQVDWRETRLVDLVGDGLADLLADDGGALRWHRSLGHGGFTPASGVDLPHTDDRGPSIGFGVAEQSLFLADMTGDGLSDIVRVRAGEVCYWPNLGHGRFGGKVTMDNAPALGPAEQFDPRRIRLADLDGSGTADLVYLGADAVRVHLNLSGNAWSAARVLTGAPTAAAGVGLEISDLLGTGTASLIWTSVLPAHAATPVHYLDPSGGTKPHLLVGIDNGMGGQTRVTYASSTAFLLADKRAGRPWRTRLPFPVQVVERVDTLDHVGRIRAVTRYAYHHGHFDGETREYRGFGRVDQLDTEELAALTASTDLPDAANVDAASYAPPVRTTTWFHTGAPADLSDEYWDGARTGAVLPAGLGVTATAAARRALTGVALRVETFGLDGTDAAAIPYAIHEHGWTVGVLEPGVYRPRATEEVEALLDRERPADRRTAHRLALRFDDASGEPLLTASVAYGRPAGGPADPLLTPDDIARQAMTRITYLLRSLTAEVALPDAGRAPLEAEKSTYELVKAVPSGALFTAAELTGLIDAASDGAHDLDADDAEGVGATGAGPYRRLLERVRTYYRAGDLTAALPLGTAGPLALPEVTHRLALTPELARHLYVDSGKLSTPELDSTLTGAGYVHSGGDGGWWQPSERVRYSPGDSDTAAQELAVALGHFFRPRRQVDAMGAVTRLDDDTYDLLLVQRHDALGNTTRATNDYRVLEPVALTDPNGNRSAVVHDALGRVAATAIMGKEGATDGDSLVGLDADPPPATVSAHLADPLAGAAALLGSATTRTITAYDASPPVASTIARETHDADTPVQVRLEYTDGLGRALQVKRSAGMGRWLTDGWKVLDNKGRPVRQYEPFYDNHPAFTFAFAVGVSPIALRDPLGHPVVIVHPDHSWEKLLTDPWRAQAWDRNDTVLLDPAADPDVGDYVRRLPATAYTPTWYTQRAGGGLGAAEQRAALNTAVHAGTPTITYLDALGRRFLTVGHNRTLRSTDPPWTTPVEERQRAEIRYDVDGRPHELIDAAGRVTARYGHDLLGNRVATATMDGGRRWMLLDVRSSQIRAWDDRGHAFTTTHDALRRVLTRTVRGTDAIRSDPRTLGRDVTYERLAYGEGVFGGEADNVRTRLVHVHDGAGILSTDRYDVKGNILRRTQQLLAPDEQLADWSGTPALEPDVWVTEMTYDALDRVRSRTTADGSVTTLTYDEVSRVATIQTRLAGAATATATGFVGSITYDAHGSRTRIAYGNGATTEYGYDPITGRLVTQRTTRPSPGDAFASRVFNSPTIVQDVRHTYDPVGNLVEIADAALQTVISGGQVVEPQVRNEYDATYRLILSSGREQVDSSDVTVLRRYVENFDHDLAGNLTAVRHSAAGSTWQRSYEYAETSLLESARMSNRLTRAPVGSETVAAYTYDAHGCMTSMPHLPSMTWDFKDQLRATTRQVAAQPETTTYSYDATGVRMRVVVRAQDGTRVAERVYLPDAEIYREFAPNGVTVTLRRDTLSIMDDQRRIALVEGPPGGTPAVRYQLADALESARIELDPAAAVITVEEFRAFGTTSLLGGRAAAEVSLKRYRYTGRERDEATLLAHHGARYYATWLGRWTSCDPEAFELPRDARLPSGREPPHSWNPYAYARGNPYRYIDPTGRADIVWISVVSIAAPILALLGVSVALDIAGVPVPGARPDEHAHWTAFMEGALFDIWTLGHYAVPAAMALLTAFALSGTGLTPEEIFTIAGMVGAAWAYTYEMWERQAFAAAYQHLGHLGVFREAALEFRVNTMEDIVIGSVASWTLAGLMLWWMGKPPDLSFALTGATIMTAVSFTFGYELVYGGHIATRDTHGYNTERNYFYRREQGQNVPDRTVWGP